MKNFYITIIGAFIILFIVVLYGVFNNTWDFSINIIDFLMLITTIIISIVVLYLTKALNNKDVVRSMIIDDIKELIGLFEQNSRIFLEFRNGQISLDETKDKIRLIFHKSDLIIDCIKKELKESFPGFFKKTGTDFTEITTTYYKWVTGGKLFDNNFNIDSDFIAGHENSLHNTISSLKLVIHKFVRYIW